MQEPKGLTVRDLLNVIYKRILILKLVVILVPIAVLLACLVAKPVYQVGAKLIVTAKRDEASLLAPSGPGPSRILNLNVDEIDLNSEMEILRSPDLWTKTVKALGLNFFKNEKGSIANLIGSVSGEIRGLLGPTKELSKDENTEAARDRAVATRLMTNFEVTPVAKSKVLNLSFKDSNPERVQKILSTLLKVYIPFHSQVYSMPGVQGFFTEQLTAAKEKFDLLRQKNTEFRKKWNLSVPERQETELITTLKMLEDAITDVNSNLNQFQKMLILLKQGNMPTGQLAPSAQRGNESTVINVLAVQLLQAGQKQLQVGEAFTANSRDYRAAQDQFNQINSKFVSALASESSVLDVKRASLEEGKKRVLSQMQTLLQKGEELRTMQLELSVAREQYLQFVSKEQAARMEGTESRQKLVDVKILGQPFIPRNPIFPKTGLYVLLAFVFSFPLGIGIIFVATFLDHSFDDPSRLEDATGYKVLATFGKIKDEQSPDEKKETRD